MTGTTAKRNSVSDPKTANSCGLTLSAAIRRVKTSTGTAGHLPVSRADGEGEENPVAADAVGGLRRAGAYGDAQWRGFQREHIQEIL